MTARAPAMTRRAVTRRLPRAGLDGDVLPVRAWLLLAAGTAGGRVFTGGYLAGGATRAGYRTPAQPASALSPGPGGWVQQLNFIVFGVLASPVLRVIAGAGPVTDGLLTRDPSGGYPPGARAGGPAVHRRWAVLAVAAGMAAIVFIAAFGAAGGHGGLAGLREHAAGAATSVLTVAVLTRLAVTGRAAARARRPGPAAGKVA